MKFTYFEEVFKLLLANKSHPSSFIDFFDNSSLLIAFNFCCKKNKFTHVSRSFKSILGYEIDNVLENNNFLNKIIHPHDKVVLQRYLCENSVTKNPFPNENDFTVPRIKCRCKHVRDYWKYLIFFSINSWNNESNSMNKTGLIANEHVRSFLHFQSIGRHRLSKRLFYSNETFKEKISERNEISVSPREVEILDLIGKGMIAKGIADKLNISTSTVITHRKNLIAKFHVHNTAELVKLSTQLMLV